jgi:hypothetical protein
MMAYRQFPTFNFSLYVPACPAWEYSKKKGPAFEEPCPSYHILVGREGIKPSTY